MRVYMHVPFNIPECTYTYMCTSTHVHIHVYMYIYVHVLLFVEGSAHAVMNFLLCCITALCQSMVSVFA